jgi:hypothetical protein
MSNLEVGNWAVATKRHYSRWKSARLNLEFSCGLILTLGTLSFLIRNSLFNILRFLTAADRTNQAAQECQLL